MTIEFTPTRKPMRELPLTAMIDVVFILIFFFMLTTSFIKIESMELLLPSASKQASVGANSTTITLKGTQTIQVGAELIQPQALPLFLANTLQAQPDHTFMVLVDEDVQMQRLVTVMDQVAIAGGNQLTVKKLRQ